jgi:hypothetical protein
MPDTADIASDREQARLAALVAANRQLIAIVWRRDDRVKHLVERTTRGRAKLSLMEEAEIDLKGSDWAIAYFTDDDIEHQGSPDLFAEADKTLLSSDDR